VQHQRVQARALEVGEERQDDDGGGEELARNVEERVVLRLQNFLLAGAGLVLGDLAVSVASVAAVAYL
jgi:hypothetical protein